jgi:hypothetical protein
MDSVSRSSPVERSLERASTSVEHQSLLLQLVHDIINGHTRSKDVRAESSGGDAGASGIVICDEVENQPATARFCLCALRPRVLSNAGLFISGTWKEPMQKFKGRKVWNLKDEAHFSQQAWALGVRFQLSHASTERRLIDCNSAETK